MIIGLFTSGIFTASKLSVTITMRSAVIIAAVASMAAANPVAVRDATFQDGIDLSAFDVRYSATFHFFFSYLS